MTTASSTPFTDEQLRAYLDGEAPSDVTAAIDTALETDDALAERLAGLDEFAALIRPAFEAVRAAAPREDLLERLRAAEAAAAAAAADPSRPVEARRWAALAAGFAAAVTTGVLIGRGPLAPSPEVVEREVVVERDVIVEREIPPPPRTWMMAVADYVALFSQETLVDLGVQPQELAQQVEKVSAAVGQDLAVAVDLPDLTLRRAELLELNGLPLAQLAYTHADGTPVAFCVILRSREPDGAPVAFRTGQARDLNAVLWDVQPRGFLVIGDRAPEELDALARLLADRLA